MQAVARSRTRGARGDELTPSASELSALTRLFSSAVFQEMAKKGRSALFKRLLEQTGVVWALRLRTRPSATRSNSAFRVLQVAGLRDEYIYRAVGHPKDPYGQAFTAHCLDAQRVSGGLVQSGSRDPQRHRHGLRDQVRAGLAYAARQPRSRTTCACFATVNVIVSESHVESVRQVVPDDVGILCLSKALSDIRGARRARLPRTHLPSDGL